MPGGGYVRTAVRSTSTITSQLMRGTNACCVFSRVFSLRHRRDFKSTTIIPMRGNLGTSLWQPHRHRHTHLFSSLRRSYNSCEGRRLWKVCCCAYTACRWEEGAKWKGPPTYAAKVYRELDHVPTRAAFVLCSHVFFTNGEHSQNVQDCFINVATPVPGT